MSLPRYLPTVRRPTGLPAKALAMATLSLTVVGCGLTPQAPGNADGQTEAVPTAHPDALIWALGSRPTTLDAAQVASDAAGTQVAAQVYDRLVRFRPGTAELAPGIVADWSSDADGLIYTFVLRDGLLFHDGTPLDAAAVVWNFQRWMDPEHTAHHGKFVAYRDYFGGFVGQKDDQGRAINLISEVTAMDQRTVRVALNAPFAPFLHHLAMVPFGFASPSAVRAQGEDYASGPPHLPVGSGPFRAVGWFDDGTVILQANEDYWAGAPAAPGMRFVTIPDLEDRARAVIEGGVHGADLAPTAPITGSLASPNVVVEARPSRSSAWLMLNLTREPLGDEVVRRALSMAIDRERLARERFGPEALPAHQLLPPGFEGHEPDLEPVPYDPAAARRLLEENGYADGFKLNIWVANAGRGYLPDPMGTAASVAEMLREIGIDASVRSENLRQFLMDRDRGRFTAWIIGWEAQSTDPDNFWFWHFGAGRDASEGQYGNADLRAALLDAQRTTNPAARDEIYRAAARTIAAQSPRLFLAHTSPLVVVSRAIQGYEPGPMGFDNFRDVSLRPGTNPVPGTAPVAEPTTTAPGTAPGTVPGTVPGTAPGTASATSEVDATPAAADTLDEEASEDSGSTPEPDSGAQDADA